MAHPSDDRSVPASSALPVIRPECRCRQYTATFVLAPALWRILASAGYESTATVGTYYCKRCNTRVPILWADLRGPLAQRTSMH